MWSERLNTHFGKRVGDASELADSSEAQSGKERQSKKSSGGSVMDRLEDVFATAEKLWKAFTQHCEQNKVDKPKHLCDTWQDLSVACKVVNTEEYLVRQYVETYDASRNKLVKRQTHAAKIWGVTHPLIAAKVKDITGM